MSAEDVVAMEADHVVIATGARWLANGRGLYNRSALECIEPHDRVFTPDDIMAGRLPQGRIVVYDDDHYYMASVIAELLRINGHPVTLVTSETMVASWSDNTNEQFQVQRRLMELDVDLVTSYQLEAFDGQQVSLECTYTGRNRTIPADALVTVTMREPDDALYHELQDALNNSNSGPKTLRRIGDCEAPAIIAAAVYAGHRYARELEADINPDQRMKHDRVFFEDV